MALQDYLAACDYCGGTGEIAESSAHYSRCPKCRGSGVQAAEQSWLRLPTELDGVKIPEGLILLAYRGSIAHGMYLPSDDPTHIDDIDLMGVVLAPDEHYLGLTEWGSRGTQEYKVGKWDCVFYEVRKMFTLLLAGNPNVLSLLWCEDRDYLKRTEAGNLLLANRQLFVGKHVYHSFAGYASGQLAKMESRDPAELREYLAVTAELKQRGEHPNCKGEYSECPEGEPQGEALTARNTSTEKLLARLRHYQKKGDNIGYLGDKRKQLVLEHGFDAKNAAHCIRLLRMCIEFLKTGEMTVRRPDAAELLEIKQGKWPLEKVKEHAKELFGHAKAAYEASTLPVEPDRVAAERLLVDLLGA